LKQNDVVRVERPGGGGLGNPLRRRTEKVLEDVRQGYVSPAQARSSYAVAIRIIDGEPVIDEAETAVLRGQS
jgi:N-methylhydantoinase B